MVTGSGEELHKLTVELNRFAVGVASAVSNLEALPKHNPYMMSGLY